MRIGDVFQTFEALVAERGWTEHAPPTALSLTELVLDWYATSRVEGVDLDADGDMLLFQWGTYDWGEGPSYQVDITRQIIDTDGEDDDGAIWQLSARLHYSAEPESSAIGAGDGWCHRPEDVDAFRSFIEESAGAAFTQRHDAIRFDIGLGQAG